MLENEKSEDVLFLKPKKWVVTLFVALFLLAGIGVRLIDLTDLPLDFSVTRQLHSLIMARGLYYQMETPETNALPPDIRQFAITTGRSEPVIEPPILENLVAITYRFLGGENILVARFYSIFFWVIGGIPLFLLSRKLINLNGAFTALAFYLFIPFGIYASRSFQPDPMMVMSVLWAWYFQITWSRRPNLPNAIAAGVFTGIAVLVKAPMVFFVGLPFAVLVLQKGFKNGIKNGQVYLMAALAILPALIYNWISATVGGNAGAIFGARFFPQLFVDVKWYLNWLQMIKGVAGHFPLVIGLLGFFFIKDKQTRCFYLSLWLAYLLYGYTFAYHIYTHNYYQLPFLPILALGMGFVVSAGLETLKGLNRHWIERALIVLILLFSLALCVQRARGSLVASSYRHEAAYWSELGKKIGNNTSVIALTHDYGYRISYWGFVNPKLWPTAGDRTVKVLSGSSDPEFLQLFKEMTVGKTRFLVTLLGEFDNQPDLKEYLFTNFPYEQGDGYYLFDLEHPLSQVN